MKRFKAFTLTEILTGTMLQAGFVIVLMGAFYMLVNFQAASTKLITAREKGQRVLAYIENRVMQAGVGLHKCTSSSVIRNNAFGNSSNFPAFNNLMLPVAITNASNTADNWSTTGNPPFYNNSSGNKIYTGNILTVLYARPDTYTSRALILDNKDSAGAVRTISGDITCKFAITNPSSYKIDSESDGGTKLKYYASGKGGNLYSYKVTVSSGAPLYISKFNDGGDFDLTTKFTGDSIDIASGSELLYLECEKMYVVLDSDNGERAFTRINLANKSSWTDAESAVGTQKYYENGILEVYFELNTATNTLDCYVLASGGKDPSLNTQRPASWPSRANWDTNNYKSHEVYVSRASWKLHNIPSSFTWN